MLELYLIADNAESPELKELELAGGLTLKEFAQLQKIGIIGNDYSFFDDFRLTNKAVEGIVGKIDSHYEKLSMRNTTIDKLEKILKIASFQEYGLIAYCD